MSTELNQRLTDMAERGEWRGADTMIETAKADLDPSRGALVPEQAGRPRWAFAAGAAVVALILIGGAALLFAGADPASDVVDEPTTIPAPTTTEAAAPTTTEATATTEAVTTTAAPTTVAPSTTATTVAPVVQSPMTWSRIPLGFDGNLGPVVPGGPGLLAVGDIDGDPGIWTSSDGISWELQPDEGDVFTDGYEIQDMVATEDGYVILGGDGERAAFVWTSLDGIEWERTPVEGVGLEEIGELSVNAITDGPAGLAVVGWTTRADEPWMLDDHFVIHSADGVFWQRADTSDLPLGGMHDVVAGGPGYVAVGVDWSMGGRAGVWTSPDGLAWTLVDPADVEPIPGMTGDDIYHMESITVSDDGQLYGFGSGSVWASDDGATWTWLGSYLGEPEEEFPSAWGGWPSGAVVIDDRVVIAGSLEYRYEGEPDRAAAWASDDGGITWQRMSRPLDVFGDDGWGGMWSLTEIDGTYVAVGAWNGEATVWVGEWNEEDGS